ncbi:MAG TPA: response regulator, partial [Candidatus Tenderia sp.]|nr:response regulator [Candidatus Tenderia sp.]
MRKGHNNKDYMTPTQVAERLLVSPVTVRQWAQKGLLEAETTPGGHRRFARAEVERFARERGIVNESAVTKILVVDDSEPFTAFLVKLLQKLPYPVEISIARDGFDAGRKVVSIVPDVVLMDIKMPGMDGYAVCEQLKADSRTKHIRVIAMTGYYTP